MDKEDWYDEYWLEALDRLCTIQSMFDVLLIEDDEEGNEVWHPAVRKADLGCGLNDIRVQLANVYQKMGQAMGLEDDMEMH